MPEFCCAFSPTRLQGAAALRDVFAAADMAALRTATLALSHCFAHAEGAARMRDLSPEAWRDAEYDYNRLFVGPTPPFAPPFASAWLEAQPVLMGNSTMEVREFYAAMGLCTPLQGRLPDDHLALELDAWIALCTLCNKKHAGDNARDIHQALVWFSDRHLGLWVPRFVRTVRTIHTVCATRTCQAAHPVPVFAVTCLELWLQSVLNVCCTAGTT